MAAVTEFAFDAFPGRLLRVALFTDVSNGRRVRMCRALKLPASRALNAPLPRPACVRSALIAQLTSGVMEPEAAFLNATVARVLAALALALRLRRLRPRMWRSVRVATR
jgi:hypothetical protein